MNPQINCQFKCATATTIDRHVLPMSFLFSCFILLNVTTFRRLSVHLQLFYFKFHFINFFHSECAGAVHNVYEVAQPQDHRKCKIAIGDNDGWRLPIAAMTCRLQSIANRNRRTYHILAVDTTQR